MQILHRLADGFQKLIGRLRIVPHKDRHELLPAVPCEQVRGALEIGSSRLGHGGDHPIPRRMAESVIVELEFVDIKHAHGEGEPEAHRFPPFGDAGALVAPAVGYAGQVVHQGLLLELRLIVVEMDVGIDPGLDDDRTEGLGHIIHRAQQQPPLLILLVGQAGQQDHGDVLGQLGGFQLPQGGKAVHVRHDDIQKDQGKAALLGSENALFGGVTDGYIVVIPQN